MLIALLVAVLFLYSIRNGSWRVPLVASALWVVIALLGGVIYPSVVQALVVNPDQKEKEATYIDRNITATRDALGIGGIQTEPVSFGSLDATKVAADEAPLKDVRLLDPNLLLTRYTLDEGQVAGLAIKDLDVDRYKIDGRVQQTVVAARELDQNNAGNTSWQGLHLIATHGCGLVGAPASSVGDNNRPAYDQFTVPITQPELYFSGDISGYAIVDTKTSEKKCEGSKQDQYTGNGGVQLNSGIRKLAFALSFFDYNLWASDSVTDTSRIQWDRDVRGRAEKLAPFLHFDRDPYPVVLNGKILWVLDAFTTTDKYPYAQDADRSQLESDSGLNHTFNYVRNSVKVTVDAYDGSVKFYAIDQDNPDPILRAWESAFPNLFQDKSTMPAGLVDHLRYPEDLFRVQTAAYARYQLTPTEFFERTNAWSVAPAPNTSPRQNSSSATATATTDQQLSSGAADDAGSTSVRFSPYYTMFHPPGSTDKDAATFSILRPYVPYSKNDDRPELKSFMVASSDPKTYGKLTAYVLTNSNLPDGPAKAATNAESQDAISSELTLLNQGEGGSAVRFGDTQLVPISGGLLYLRPLFVLVNNQAEYREIIVSYQSKAVISDTIGNALAQLFPGFEDDIGDRPTTTDGTGGQGTPPTTPPSSDTPNALLQQAQDLFDQADEALKKSPPDYATYGAKQEQARKLIQQAIDLLQGNK